MVGRAALLVTALFLLSPAQFPWYAAWALAFLPLVPRWWLVALALTMPLYYVGFHHLARDTYAVQKDVIVWLIWLPVWALLLAEWAMTRTRARETPDAAATVRPSSAG